MSVLGIIYSTSIASQSNNFAGDYIIQSQSVIKLIIVNHKSKHALKINLPNYGI